MEKSITQNSETIKGTDKLCEYDFLVQLEKILMLNNTPILLSELNVFSGYALRFVYSYESPEIYNNSLSYIAKNLSDFLGIELNIEDVSEDIGFYLERINKGIPMIFYPENILVYAFKEDRFTYHRMFFEEEGNPEEIINRNSKVVILLNNPAFPRKDLYQSELFMKIISLLLNNYNPLKRSADYRRVSLLKKGAEYKGISAGFAAYEDFAMDLRNSQKDFSSSKLWLNQASYAQWTAIYGVNSYFLGYYYFINHGEQEMFRRMLKGADDAILYWKEFGRTVGRESFNPPNKEIPIEQRRHAANAVDKAKESIEYMVREAENML